MHKGRAEAFSDGVLAVAITLLVLDLHVEASGHGPLITQVRHEWPSFAAYVVSFFVIGVIWINHNALFNLIDRVDRVLLFENLLLLMFVTTLPFTTSTFAAYLSHGGSDARWAAGLYGISNIGMALGFTAMLSRMVNHGLLIHPVSEEVGRSAVRRFGLGAIAYPAVTLAGIGWPPIILLGFGLLTVYYMFERTQIVPAGEPGAAR